MKAKDKYATFQERNLIRAQVRQALVTHLQLSHKLGLSQTHVSQMLGGSRPMAKVHLLAIRYVLILHKSAVLRARRAQAAAPRPGDAPSGNQYAG